MKKSKLLLIPLVAVASSMGVLLANTNDVVALNNEACSAEYFRDEYLQKISVEYNENTATLTNNSGVNLTYRFIADGNTANAVTGNFDNGTNINLTVSNGGLVYFYLKDAMTEGCKADAGSEIGKMEINNEGLIDNPLYNDSICVNYRNKWGNNEVMQNAVPYCYSAKTYSSYTREEVQGWIDTAESLYESSGSGGNDIIIDSSYQEVKDVKKTDKLVCDAFSTNNYETMHKYYHIDTENDGDGCQVTCKEEIEVNFSDPVATQAGMCFQYLIEIKSKVVCDASYNAKPPTRKQVCYPTPVCVSGSASYDAGGPSDEFDSCVKTCDGGKYTQKCIDSCYNKVYKNKKTSKTSSDKLTSNEIKATTSLYVPNDSFYEATRTAASCNWSTAEELYQLRQQYPGGYYKGVNWIQSGPCPSNLGPYYYRSLAQTRQTLAMMDGSYSYSGGNLGYNPDGNGILRENYGNYYCNDYCYWSGSCGSNTVLTERQAQEEYEKAVEEYLSKKRACEQKAATCSNETTDYEIVVDNVDTDNRTDDDQEHFTANQKMNSNKVNDTWDKPNNSTFKSMVILADGTCEDGEDDPWHYHNIITFPGTWINNKTGQTVHSIDPGHEDFYTYVGNEYCTKLNSVPINTAWYDWKVNQNGDTSALTDQEKKQIEDNLEMNINGHIDNYGYFGWNFDISCFYAIGEPEEECTPDDPNFPLCDESGNGNPGNPPESGGSNNESPVNQYEFRSISLDNLFPNSVTPTGASEKDIQASNLINEVESLRSNNLTQVDNSNIRDIGFNWTCAATNLENPDYLIQPVTVLNQIQALGDSIYEGDEYLDYHIRLTPETMQKVRNYNDKYDSYVEPTDADSSEVLTAGNKKTSGITVYRSYLLHKVLNSNELLSSGLIGCNNEDNGTCPRGTAAIDTTTRCYNEYVSQSSVLKGDS